MRDWIGGCGVYSSGALVGGGVMKKPNITQGPWVRHGSHIYGEPNAIIAIVQNPGMNVKDYPLLANAKAIEAVPDLIEALILAKTKLEEEGYFPSPEIEAALLKAGCTDD